MEWLAQLFSPFLDWIQVEVTSHCNASCMYCPNSVFKDRWEPTHMPMDLYQRLSRAFSRTSLVYLQGWGEPLLHPQFFDMVRIARACDCQVGTTTNGVLLREELAERMVQEGLGVVGFSLAGTDESQDKIRTGAPFHTVLEAMQRLHEAKERHGTRNPAVHVAYIWLQSQREAVRQLPELLEGRGVRQAVVSTLDFVPRADLSKEVIQARTPEEEVLLKGIIADVVEEGHKRGVEIIFYLFAPSTTQGLCTENVMKALVVSSRGLVSPCVFGTLPLAGGTNREPESSDKRSSLICGDLHDRSLAQIWRKRSYRLFRKGHLHGRPPRACANCPKLYI